MKKYCSLLIVFSLLSILALTSLSCSSGGDDETSSGDNGAPVTTAYDIDEVVNEITTTMGEDAGLGAVLLAIDKGYSLEQVVDAVMTGELQTDGNIMDAKGSIAYPEDLPMNLIEATQSSGIFIQIEKYDLEGLKSKCKELVNKLASEHPGLQLNVYSLVIFRLLDKGYSPEQVFSAMFLGNVQLMVIDSDYSSLDMTDSELRIIDDQGKRVVPTDSPLGIFSPYSLTIQGPTSLELKDGNAANGAWEVTLTRGSCPRYYVVYYWGDGDVTDVYGSYSANHDYEHEGIYQLRAHFTCRDDGDDAWSNTLLVEVKKETVQAACPEGTWDVKYDLNCSGGTVNDEVWVFYFDWTWEKTEFASCGWEGAWDLQGNALRLATNVNDCYYTGTVNSDCSVNHW